MSGKRRRFTSKFKAKVSWDAARGEKAISELAAQYQVHPHQISEWQKRLIGQAEELFRRGKSSQSKNEEEITDPLYEEMGRLKMNIKWLEKKI